MKAAQAALGATALMALSWHYAAAAPAVATTNVNLRQGPGTASRAITTIPAGAPIDVTGCEGQWCQVTFQGQSGFVIATSVGQGGPRGLRHPATGRLRHRRRFMSPRRLTTGRTTAMDPIMAGAAVMAATVATGTAAGKAKLGPT